MVSQPESRRSEFYVADVSLANPNSSSVQMLALLSVSSKPTKSQFCGDSAGQGGGQKKTSLT